MMRRLFKYMAFGIGVALLAVIRIVPGVGDEKSPYDTAADLLTTPTAHADTPHGGGGDACGCGDGGGGDAGCGGDAGGSGNDAGDGCSDGPCSNF